MSGVAEDSHLINSLGVVLMLYSGSGISAISSVPYAFSEVFPHVTLGTWTYIFQGLLILSLMIMRKKFVVPYLFSFVVGFVFSEMLDLYEADCNGIQSALFCDQLSSDLFWNCSFQPVWSADHPNRSVSERTFGYHKIQIFQN